MKNKWAIREVKEKLTTPDEIKALLRKEEWNMAKIVAKENMLTHYLNNQIISQVEDNDTINRSLSGKIGVQVHVGPPMIIQYKSIIMRELK